MVPSSVSACLPRHPCRNRVSHTQNLTAGESVQVDGEPEQARQTVDKTAAQPPCGGDYAVLPNRKYWHARGRTDSRDHTLRSRTVSLKAAEAPSEHVSGCVQQWMCGA